MRPWHRRHACLIALVLLCSACDHRPKKPDDLLLQIERVVTSADATEAWKIVDPETQEVVKALFSDERAYAAALAQMPATPAITAERTRTLATQEADVIHFFAAQCHTWQLIEGYRKRLGSASGPVQKKEDGPNSVWLARFDGMAFHAVKAGSGWAWADLKGEWQLEYTRVKKAVEALHAATTKNEGP